jgi:uncharacterized protein
MTSLARNQPLEAPRWGRAPALLVALIMLVLSWSAAAWAAPAVPPLPPAPEARVTDRVGVMSPAARQSLERRLAAYEAQTGHQIIVWIDRSTGEFPIETFALAAFERWKLGRAGLDDGLGMFIMVEDRVIRLEVGYGLEPTVTDLVASQVIRSMTPAIERGEWDVAVTGGVAVVVDAIEGVPGSLPGDPGSGEIARAPPEPWEEIVKIVGIVIFVLLMIFLVIKYPRLALLLLFVVGRGRGGGGMGGGGGFGGGGGGRSGGGGATGRW